MQETSSSLLVALSTILNSEVVRWLLTGIVEFWHSSRFRGIYRVEDYHTTLELMDRFGKRAVATKHQWVEFLQDGVFAIQDQAWGDGEIFASYKCSPGVAVDRHIESYRWKILISLRRTMNKGDRQEFIIERAIKNGFMTSTEHFQAQIDHPMRQFTITVIFPAARLPKSVILMEQNAKRSFQVKEQYITPLSRGRVQYQWEVAKPRLYEAYILKWDW